MKNSTRLLLGAISLAGMACSALPAFAQDAPAWGLTAAIDLQTDYKFRGISQNDREPSPQGTLNMTAPDGFYVGTWMSTVNWNLQGSKPTLPNHNPTVEVDVYGGKHTDLWGVDWNFEPYYYAYPSSDSGSPNFKADYLELIDQLTKSVGPATFTATWAWSPDFSLGSGTGNYLAGMVSYTITDWLSISGNVGHQWVQAAKYNASSDYTYADIGATATWHSFALDLRYSGTDLSAAKCGFYIGTNHACAGNFIATFTYNMTLLP